VPFVATQNGQTPLDLARDGATRAALRNTTKVQKEAHSTAAAGAEAAAEHAARDVEARIAAADRERAAVVTPKGAAVAINAPSSVPADVAALLSSLSLSAYAAPLCAKLGMTCARDAALLTDADWDSVGMKLLERRKLLQAATALTAAPAANAAPIIGMCDVMISYRVPETGEGGDKSVFVLQAALEARGFRVFVGEAAIEGGSSWPTTIQRGVEECQAFVVLCSPTYGDDVASKWTKRELELADNLNKPLIPVWHSGPYPPKPVAIFLGGTQRIPGGTFSAGYVAAKISHEAVAEEVAVTLARIGVTPHGGQQQQK
jgi:hypothetical protein